MSSILLKHWALVLIVRHGHLGGGTFDSQDTLQPMPSGPLGESPPSEWYPPGHGDVYHALYASGLLENLINQVGMSFASSWSARTCPALSIITFTQDVVYQLSFAAATKAKACRRFVRWIVMALSCPGVETNDPSVKTRMVTAWSA